MITQVNRKVLKITKHKIVIWCFIIGFVTLFNPYNIEAQIEKSSHHISISDYTEIEGQIIRYGDIISASKVVARLQVLNRRRGNQAVVAAVPNLIYRLEEILEAGSMESEGEGEFMLGLINLLANIGDRRAKGVLLKCLNTGSSVALGLSKMDRGIVREIAGFLNSDDSQKRHGAAYTLKKIHSLNPGLFSSSDISFVRDRLVSRLNESLKMPYLYALGIFGDSSTLPLLDQIANQDTVMVRNKRVNRNVAAQSAQKIRER